MTVIQVVINLPKRYISKKDLARVKELDLLTYFKNYAPEELVRKGRNDYVTRTHGSLHMSNGLWCWWAQSKGGRTALSYFIDVEGMEFLDAALYLRDLIQTKEPIPVKQQTKSIYRFRLPQGYENNSIIEKYLTTERKIDKEIIKECIQSYLIYESNKDHSVVFIGRDKNHFPKFACIRSTDSPLKKDVPGSDKRYSFQIRNSSSRTLHVFESAIDLLSYLTLEKRKESIFQRDNYLSIDGATLIGKSISKSSIPVALDHFLNQNDIHTIKLHLDNDKAGKETTQIIHYHLNGKYEVLDLSPQKCKDINDELLKKNFELQSKNCLK